ncbi:MAG: helix-turn-helix transcriptional regulator [Nitratireductor sp.]|nr:helix-turn-helix transcriptional regulator [Nitratireductor sp.]
MPRNKSQSIFEQPLDSDTLGSRIYQAREAAGMDKETVATNLGVRVSTLDSWEKDRSEPRAHHLVRLAGMLGVSASWMMGGVGQAPFSDSIRDEVALIRRQLDHLKEMRDRTSLSIVNIENTLDRLLEREDF